MLMPSSMRPTPHYSGAEEWTVLFTVQQVPNSLKNAELLADATPDTRRSPRVITYRQNSLFIRSDLFTEAATPASPSYWPAATAIRYALHATMGSSRSPFHPFRQAPTATPSPKRLESR